MANPYFKMPEYYRGVSDPVFAQQVGELISTAEFEHFRARGRLAERARNEDEPIDAAWIRENRAAVDSCYYTDLFICIEMMLEADLLDRLDIDSFDEIRRSVDEGVFPFIETEMEVWYEEHLYELEMDWLTYSRIPNPRKLRRQKTKVLQMYEVSDGLHCVRYESRIWRVSTYLYAIDAPSGLRLYQVWDGFGNLHSTWSPGDFLFIQ